MILYWLYDFILVIKSYIYIYIYFIMWVYIIIIILLWWFICFYIGFNANYQWKTDNKYWNNDSGHAVNSVSLEFGWHFN